MRRRDREEHDDVEGGAADTEALGAGGGGEDHPDMKLWADTIRDHARSAAARSARRRRGSAPPMAISATPTAAPPEWATRQARAASSAAPRAATNPKGIPHRSPTARMIALRHGE